MIKKIATLVGYKKAPRSTYLLKNPKKGLKALAAWKGTKMVARSPVKTAVGAVLAIPLAVFTYRKIAEER